MYTEKHICQGFEIDVLVCICEMCEKVMHCLEIKTKTLLIKEKKSVVNFIKKRHHLLYIVTTHDLRNWKHQRDAFLSLTVNHHYLGYLNFTNKLKQILNRFFYQPQDFSEKKHTQYCTLFRTFVHLEYSTGLLRVGRQAGVCGVFAGAAPETEGEQLSEVNRRRRRRQWAQYPPPPPPTPSRGGGGGDRFC